MIFSTSGNTFLPCRDVVDGDYFCTMNKWLVFIILLGYGVAAVARSNEVTYRYQSVAYPLKEIFITSPFGVRTDPFTKRKTRHNGIDLRACYEPVYAMLAGEVVGTGKDKRSGNYVTLRHGGFTVSYCHLSRVSVRKGARVRAGDPLGVSGNSGRSTGPHLHLTVKYGRQYVNPDILLQFVRRIRGQSETHPGGLRTE